MTTSNESNGCIPGFRWNWALTAALAWALAIGGGLLYWAAWLFVLSDLL
jgi:hypothetical protein